MDSSAFVSLLVWINRLVLALLLLSGGWTAWIVVQNWGRDQRMNKRRQTRLFAIGSTAVAALVFAGLTIDSHRQFPCLPQSQNITVEVKRGKDVWHANNCRLPYAVRRGRVLRAGPDQDHAAPGCSLPAGLHARSVAVLRREAPRMPRQNLRTPTPPR